MVRALGRFIAGVSLALLCATIVQAAAADKPAKKDPIELAFTLPKTAKLTPDQQAEFDKLRADKEPELRAAWDQYQSAKDATGKSTAMKKFNELKKDLKAAIAKITNPKSGAGTKKPAVTKPIKEKPIKPIKERPIRKPGNLKPSLP